MGSHPDYQPTFSKSCAENCTEIILVRQEAMVQAIVVLVSLLVHKWPLREMIGSVIPQREPLAKVGLI